MKVVRPGTAPRGGAAKGQGPWWKIRITPTVSLVVIVVVVGLIYGVYWFMHRGGAAGLPMVKVSQEDRMKALPPDIQRQLRDGSLDWSEIPSQTLAIPMKGSAAAQQQQAQQQQAQQQQAPQAPAAPR